MRSEIVTDFNRQIRVGFILRDIQSEFIPFSIRDCVKGELSTSLIFG